MRKEPRYIGVFTENMQSNIKILLLITKNQILQVSDFCAFLCTGRCKKLGSLKLFLRQASQIPSHLGPVSRAQFPARLHPEFPLALTVGHFRLLACQQGRTTFLTYWKGRRCSLSTQSLLFLSLSCVSQSQSRLQLFATLWNFPGKNTGVGCHFLFQAGNLPDPGIEHQSLVSPALAGRVFTNVSSGNSQFNWQHLFPC